MKCLSKNTAQIPSQSSNPDFRSVALRSEHYVWSPVSLSHQYQLNNIFSKLFVFSSLSPLQATLLIWSSLRRISLYDYYCLFKPSSGGSIREIDLSIWQVTFSIMLNSFQSGVYLFQEWRFQGQSWTWCHKPTVSKFSLCDVMSAWSVNKQAWRIWLANVLKNDKYIW